MLRREHLWQQIVALRVIRASQVEVAALERARLLLEQEVVGDAEPLDLFVGRDARHRHEPVGREEGHVCFGGGDLEPRARKRRQVDVGHAG